MTSRKAAKERLIGVAWPTSQKRKWPHRKLKFNRSTLKAAMSNQNQAINLVDAILYQCRLQPPTAAICAPGADLRLVSYRRLEQFIHNTGRRLTAFGLASGSIAAIDVREPALHVAIILALMRLGVATVSVRDAVPGNLAIEAIITDRSETAATGSKVIPIDLSWTAGDGTPVDTRRVVPNGAE